MSGGMKGGSQSQSSSEQFSRSFVDPAQAPYLDLLRQQGQNLSLEQLGRIREQITPMAGQLGTQAQGVLSRVFGAQTPDVMADVNRFQQTAIDPLVSQLGTDVNRQLQRQLGGAGGINQQAAMAGTLGGGRNQVERGLAQEAALNAFQRGATQLRSGGVGQGLQAAQLQGALGNATNATLLGGLSQAQTPLNLGMAGFTAEAAPLMNLTQLIGRPTVLQESEGMTQSSSSSTQGIGQTLGGIGSLFGGYGTLLGAMG